MGAGHPRLRDYQRRIHTARVQRGGVNPGPCARGFGAMSLWPGADWPVGSWLKLALVGSIAQPFWDVSRRCTCTFAYPCQPGAGADRSEEAKPAVGAALVAPLLARVPFMPPHPLRYTTAMPATAAKLSTIVEDLPRRPSRHPRLRRRNRRALLPHAPQQPPRSRRRDPQAEGPLRRRAQGHGRGTPRLWTLRRQTIAAGKARARGSSPSAASSRSSQPATTRG